MKENNRLRLLVLVAVFALGACSQTPKENDQSWHLPDNYNGGRDNTSNGQVEEEGPQYQTPTMDVLKGVTQKFPAKFPVGRYPNAKVAMVDVRASRHPGDLNMVLLKTADEIPKVGDYYRQKLATEQWKKVSDYHNEIYDSTRWEKDNLQCEVRLAQDFSKPNGQRFIQLLYTVKPKKRQFKPFLPPPQAGKR